MKEFDQFPNDASLPPTEENYADFIVERVDNFQDKFGARHLYLAMHCAFPATLPPQLCYLIRDNFQYDSKNNFLDIPFEAVPDLLLSELCQEVGHEVYQMEAEMRQYLLKRLRESSRFGEERLQVLSKFISQYYGPDLSGADLERRNVAEAQLWASQLQTDSSQSVSQLSELLAFAQNEGDNNLQYRLNNLIAQYEAPEENFQELKNFVKGNAMNLMGLKQEAHDAFSMLQQTTNEVNIGGRGFLRPEIDLEQGNVVQEIDLNQSGLGAEINFNQGDAIVDEIDLNQRELGAEINFNQGDAIIDEIDLNQRDLGAEINFNQGDAIVDEIDLNQRELGAEINLEQNQEFDAQLSSIDEEMLTDGKEEDEEEDEDGPQVWLIHHPEDLELAIELNTMITNLGLPRMLTSSLDLFDTMSKYGQGFRDGILILEGIQGPKFLQKRVQKIEELLEKELISGWPKKAVIAGHPKRKDKMPELPADWMVFNIQDYADNPRWLEFAERVKKNYAARTLKK